MHIYIYTHKYDVILYIVRIFRCPLFGAPLQEPGSINKHDDSNVNDNNDNANNTDSGNTLHTDDTNYELIRPYLASFNNMLICIRLHKDI